MKGLGHSVSATAVRTLLRETGLGTGRLAWWNDLTRVPSHAAPQPAGRRLLHRRHDLAPTAVCALLIELGESPRPSRGLHAESARVAVAPHHPTCRRLCRRRRATSARRASRSTRWSDSRGTRGPRDQVSKPHIVRLQAIGTRARLAADERFSLARVVARVQDLSGELLATR